jgi:FAD:protein FMN transferase
MKRARHNVIFLKTLVHPAVLFLSLVALVGIQSPVFGQARLRGETMGTYYSILLDGTDGNAAATIQPAVTECLADVNRQMSTWDPESEISKFNQQQTTDWIAVSPEFALVVQEAKRIHDLTTGAFDPTVSPLIDLWGFGDRRPQHIPTTEDIASAKRHVGMNLIEVQTQPPALRKTDPAVQLNLSAIAKGHGVDRLSQLLTDAGFPAHVVDIGGENRTGIAKSSGESWRLGVESPLGGLNRILEVTETAVATSGDYRNYFEIDGVRYSHAINPVTGKPVANPPASISVVHPSCMTADAFATAFMVLGVERGLQLARQEKLSVMFQTVDDNDNVVEDGTGVFETSSANQSNAWWLPFVAALGIFMVAIAGMAIGVLVKNRELKGSCGGLAAMSGEDDHSACELCTVPKDQCVNSELRAEHARQVENCEPPVGV